MMKKSVMDRPMFKGKNREEIDVENVGIMSGFKDDMDLEGLLSELGEGEEDMYDSAAMLDRRPDSPEILMNNLRGDMQSIDSRREELADLVGYNAAMETPDEVLALLQSQMSGGIGTLPAGPAGPAPMDAPPMPAGMPPMPPDMGAQMPPPMPAGMPPGMPPDMGAQMPPGMPPGMMPPMNMAAGGIVQRFSEGSDEDGVTRNDETSSFPPELVDQSQREMLRFLAQQPIKTPSLREAMTSRMPVYRELLGADSKDMTQGQALLDLTQGFLNLAANRGPQGEALRGSGASRLAGAFRGVPTQLIARAGELGKQEQAVKLAALQAGEKEIENIRAQNVKLIESQRKTFTDIAKSSGKSIFGKGDWEYSVINTPNLIASWSVGKTTPEQDNLVQSAISVLRTPIIETRVDPVTKEAYQVTRPRELPPFLTQAIEARSAFKPIAPEDAAAAPPSAAPAAPATEVSPVATAPASQVKELGTGIRPTGSALPGPLPGTGEAGSLPQRGGIWGMSADITGPGARAAGLISGTPGLGAPFPKVTQAQNLAKQEVESLIEAFIKSDKAAVDEQKRLRELYDIGPKFFDDPAALRDRLIAIDEEIAKEIDLTARQAYNTELPPDTRAKARTFLSAAEKFRSSLGVPVRIYTEEQRDKLPVGTKYLWEGRFPARRLEDQK
jgi:hypothetical protein